MAGNALVWDETGKRTYETGVENVALYVMDDTGTYGEGVAWNGVTGITESPSGAETTSLYADDIKYLTLISAEEYGFTIEAYGSPEEFDACDGMAELTKGVSVRQQSRKPFGLAYKTKLGNDVKGTDYGYKLHLIYGAQASPSEKGYSTINDSPEAITLSWEATTTPINVTGHKATAHIEIDSTKIDPAKLQKLEDALFGGTAKPKLLLPDEIVQTVNAG